MLKDITMLIALILFFSMLSLTIYQNVKYIMFFKKNYSANDFSVWEKEFQKNKDIKKLTSQFPKIPSNLFFKESSEAEPSLVLKSDGSSYTGVFLEKHEVDNFKLKEKNVESILKGERPLLIEEQKIFFNSKELLSSFIILNKATLNRTQLFIIKKLLFLLENYNYSFYKKNVVKSSVSANDPNIVADVDIELIPRELTLFEEGILFGLIDGIDQVLQADYPKNSSDYSIWLEYLNFVEERFNFWAHEWVISESDFIDGCWTAFEDIVDEL